MQTAASIPAAILSDADRAQHFLDSGLGFGTSTIFDNGVFLFSSDGTLIAESPFRPGRRGKDYSFRQYFQRTVSGRAPVISAPYISSQNHGHPAVNFTAPVFDNGSIVALLAGSMDLTKENFLGRLSKVRIGETGYLYLFSRDRRIIMHPDKSRIMQKDVPSGSNPLFDRAIEGFEGSGETVNSRGLHALASFKHLGGVDWILAANYPIAEALMPVRQARTYILWGLSGLLGFSSLLVWLYMNHLISPLAAFTDYIRQRTNNGAQCQPPDIHSHDEIGTLADAFNKLIYDLDGQKDFTSQLIQNSAVACFVLDRDHRVLIWSRACEELTGLSSSEVIGTDRHWRAFYRSRRPCLADLILEGDIEKVLDLYDRFANSLLLPEGLQAEGWFESVGGKKRYLLFEAAPVRNRENEVVAVIETLQDITSLKQAEEALRETNESYQSLIERAPAAILVHRAGRILLGNQASAELFGCESGDDLKGMRLLALIHPDDRDQVWARINAAQYENREQPYEEERILRPDGTSALVEAGSIPVRYAGETAVQTILRDITDAQTGAGAHLAAGQF